MTQELTQEVEEIVKEFEEMFCCQCSADCMHLSDEAGDDEAACDWLRTQLSSLAEKAEERRRVHGNERYNEGYKHGEEDGAQEMKEKAIACVPREWESSVGNYNDGFCDAVSQILTALTSLSLTNE